MQHKPVTLIKLGGSIITDKEIPMSLRPDVLVRLVREIARARKEQPERLFVVGHGQGSFGHVPATKYKTIDGFVNAESLLGMAIVLDSAAQLNRLVVHEFLREGIPAVSMLPSHSLITHKRSASIFFTDVFEEYIKTGLFPVTCGDVILDKHQGCTIWSTEQVLAFFAQQFVDRGWKVEQIIHVTEVTGVYDQEGKVIPTITRENWPTVKKGITPTKGFDVTGGMMLKVEESLQLADKKIGSTILSGLEEDNLYRALTRQSFNGTVVQ